jgi:hypothetical protein
MLRKWWRSFMLLVLGRAPEPTPELPPPRAADLAPERPPPLPSDDEKAWLTLAEAFAANQDHSLREPPPEPPPLSEQPPQPAQEQPPESPMSGPATSSAWIVHPNSYARKSTDEKAAIKVAIAEAVEDVDQIAADRQERRRLERARIKRDVLVEPKIDHIEHGEKPPPAEPKLKKKRKKAEIVEDDDDIILADELVEGDGKGDVLFERQEFYGEFNFRDSILDQLDRYWFYLSRIKDKHPKTKDTFELYRQIGAVLVPHALTGVNRSWDVSDGTIKSEEELAEYKSEIKLTKWFKDNRPAWGCIAWGTSELGERREREHKVLIPKFMHFTRFTKPPPMCQPAPGPGDVYVMTIWWDTPHSKCAPNRKHGTPNEIPIFVSADGENIISLKHLETRYWRVGKPGNNFNYELIPERAWCFPKHYDAWAAQHGLTVDVHLPHLFCSLMRDYEYSQTAEARVSITKDNLTATFGINPRRFAYFFRDRDIIVTVNGQRKRILHHVSAHTREDGTEVKEHYRGARQFKWAGYDVYITIPGRDHMPLHEFNVGVIDEHWKEKGEKLISEPEIGRALSQIVHGVDPIEALKRMKAS